MKRLLLLLAVCGIAFNNADARKSSSQNRLTVNIGIGGLFAQSRTDSFRVRTVFRDTILAPFSVTGIAGCIYVYPKYHFLARKTFSVSIGLPLLIGISPKRQVQDRDMNDEDLLPYAVGLSVPLMADFNYGGCVPEAAAGAPFGFFIGGGIAFSHLGAKVQAPEISYTNIADEDAKNIRINNLGLRIHAGIKLTANGFPLSLSGGYQLASGNKGNNIIDITLSIQL